MALLLSFPSSQKVQELWISKTPSWKRTKAGDQESKPSLPFFVWRKGTRIMKSKCSSSTSVFQSQRSHNEPRFCRSILGDGMTRDGGDGVRKNTHKASRLHPSPSHPHIPEEQGGGRATCSPSPASSALLCSSVRGKKKRKKKNKTKKPLFVLFPFFCLLIYCFVLSSSF